eukprot:5591251-Prymnesium_polylepis.2
MLFPSGPHLLNAQVDTFNQCAPSFRAYCQSASQGYKYKDLQQKMKRQSKAKQGITLQYGSAWVRMVTSLINVDKFVSTALVALSKVCWARHHGAYPS